MFASASFSCPGWRMFARIWRTLCGIKWSFFFGIPEHSCKTIAPSRYWFLARFSRHSFRSSSCMPRYCEQTRLVLTSWKVSKVSLSIVRKTSFPFPMPPSIPDKWSLFGGRNDRSKTSSNLITTLTSVSYGHDFVTWNQPTFHQKFGAMKNKTNTLQIVEWSWPSSSTTGWVWLLRKMRSTYKLATRLNHLAFQTVDDVCIQSPK